MQIKNILFDFGGVIASLDKDKAFNRFKELGIVNIDDYLNEFRQSGIFLEYEEGKINENGFYEAFRKLSVNKNVTDSEIDSGWLAFIKEVPDYKIDLLIELATKYNLYLLSNTNPSVIKWANSPNFTSHGKPLKDYFIKAYLSFEIGHAKPDSEIYEYIIKDSGMNPAETLFVDDGKANVLMGENLGFKTYQANQDENLREAFIGMGLL